MKRELDKDVIWSLRALAQDAYAQRDLYPTFAVVADELVMGFYDAYSKYKETHLVEHDDLEALDAHIASKSGISEFWTDEALESFDFWREIRDQAKNALKVRNLSTFAPHPNPNTFVSGADIWTAGRRKEVPLDSTPTSFLSKLLNRFR